MKARLRVIVAATCLSLLVAGNAHAFVLYTAPAGGSNNMFCDIVNVSARSLRVKIEAFAYDGALIDSAVAETKAPGTGTYLQVTNPAGAAYCKFTVTSATVVATKQMVRAMAVYDWALPSAVTVLAQ